MDTNKLTHQQRATRSLAWMIVAMWGMLFAAPSQAQTATLLPATLTFGSTAVGSTSASQRVSITNFGTRSMTIGAVNFDGNQAGSFIIASTTCQRSLQPGRSCNYNVAFRPQAQGALTATLNISNNGIVGGVSKVSLAGTGTPPLPVLVVSATTLAFSSVNLNVVSGPRTVVISNTGQGTLNFTSVSAITQTAGAGFVISATTCGATVVSGASCTLSVTFTPTSNGAKTGTLAIKTNGSPATVNVSLTGTGVTPAPVLLVTPTSVAFGNAALNVTSGPRSVTVANNGQGVLTFSPAPAITSQTATAGLLISSNNCGASLNPGLTCTINVTFKPTTTGAKTGTLAIRTNGSPATVNVSISGTGVTPTPVLTLTPSATTLTCSNPYGGPVFASIAAANTGTANVVLGAIAFTGTGASYFSQTNLCPNPLVSGAACSIAVKFSPTGKTSRTATLTVASNGGNRSVALTGSCASHPSP